MSRFDWSRSLRTKSTMGGRSLGAALVVLLVSFAHGGAAQAQALTVDDAIDRAFAHAGLDAVSAASTDAIHARADAEVVHPSARAFGDVEAVGGDGTSVEVTLGASWVVDPSGWRARQRDVAAWWAESDAAGRDGARLAIATEVRRAFWLARAHDARLAAFDARIDAASRGLAALQARYERGDVARYAVVRVERELAAVHAERTSVQADRDAALAELRALTGAGSGVQPTGALRPPREAMDPGAAPSIRALDAAAQGWDAMGEVHQRWGLRDWELDAGYRLARSAAATGHGGVVSLSIPIGGRATADAARAVARSEATLARAERAHAEHLVDHHRTDARGRLDVAFAALDALPADDTDDLVALAEAAWAAGEAPLADVLDAWRSEAELTLLRIDLEWAAREAAIDLAATGLQEAP